MRRCGQHLWQGFDNTPERQWQIVSGPCAVSLIVARVRVSVWGHLLGNGSRIFVGFVDATNPSNEPEIAIA
eukprot:2119430-Amphidinium_carterae.3